MLNRSGVFEVGYILVYLAFKFKRDEFMIILFILEVISYYLRRVFCIVCLELVVDIRK